MEAAQLAGKSFPSIRPTQALSLRIHKHPMLSTPATDPCGIGGRTEADQYFHGNIADVRIWNDVRTATEIANNYEITGLDNEANLIGYWDLREPDNAQDVVPEANDRSSSNHDGTVHGPVVSLDAPGGVKKFAVTLTDSDLDNTSNTGPLLSSTIAESINTLVATQRRPRVINTTLTYSETVANDSFSDQVGTITATDLETNRSDLRFQLINGVDQSGSPLEVNGISYDYSREETYTANGTTYSYGTFHLNTTTGQYLFRPNDSGIERLHSNKTIRFDVRALDNHPSDPKISPAGNIYIVFTAIDDVNTIDLGVINDFTEQTETIVAPNALVTAVRDGITELQLELSSPSQTNGSLEFIDNSYLSTAANVDALDITGDITLEAWIKLEEYPADWGQIIGKYAQT